MNQKNKTVIIGIDGVPYGLMKDLSDKDIMSNFKDLRKDGIFTKMKSSIPEVSSVSWSSIITGKNPGEHGVYGFTDIIKRTYTLSFHHFKKLKAPTFWQKNGFKKYVIVNVPSTYPAQKINGLLISGFVSPDFERAVYPPSYVRTLKTLNYKIDIDSEKGYKSKKLLFKELFETLELRRKICEFLWEKINWDIFMLVFTGTDRLGHFLWDAYENKNHEFHLEFIEFFKRIDEAIGNINGKLKENDSLIILSDHGMEKIKTNVNINAYLAEDGYLILGDNPKKGYNNIKDGTKAFALEPSRIYLNKAGKYPRGSVKEKDEDKIIEELTDFFSNIKINGEKVLRKVYRKEEIYHGNQVENAPDLVLLSNPGFNLRASLFKKEPFEKDSLTGKHTQEDAFLYIKNKENGTIIPEEPSVENVTVILDRLD
jgi:predicted AlkP superfamily phosphohydrolase/phosphomutase